ncbi:hypothetical protein E2C01_010569 [Portunus trituberculatus]|uniref:Uncharacterized protein n=1 Tax=Portunus trituberculatus TaxID=210409 RepID=A0A5B7D977_PORTR|nr:hypothetical protein [Portunus trituberculatus]
MSLKSLLDFTCQLPRTTNGGWLLSRLQHDILFSLNRRGDTGRRLPTRHDRQVKNTATCVHNTTLCSTYVHYPVSCPQRNHHVRAFFTTVNLQNQ